MNEKIAILILAHKQPEQLLRLVRTLDDKRFDIYIHIDKKKDESQFSTILRHNPNIHFANTRIETYLNDFSLVDATMSLVKSALSNSAAHYKYHILLTGQDYPIKSTDYIYRHLLDNYPTCFIDSYPVKKKGDSTPSNWTEHLGHDYFSQHLRRLAIKTVGNKTYFSRAGKLIKIPIKGYDAFGSLLLGSPRRRISRLKTFTYSAGSHFWILPDTAINHIVAVYDRHQTLNNIFRHSPAPEESYFQTALSSMVGAVIPDASAQFAERHCEMDEMDNVALRLIKWYENGTHTSGHPAIWKDTDLQLIKQSNALFARKFDMMVDGEILNLIDSEILTNVHK